MTFVVRSRAGQTPCTFLLSQRHEFFMNVCVCVCWGGASAASIAISAAARVIVQQWLQCRRGGGETHYLIILQRAIGRKMMERGAEQDTVREDINCVVRQSDTWLLCRCLITDLYPVIAGRKCFGNAAVGPTAVVSNYLGTVTVLKSRGDINTSGWNKPSELFVRVGWFILPHTRPKSVDFVDYLNFKGYEKGPGRIVNYHKHCQFLL